MCAIIFFAECSKVLLTSSLQGLVARRYVNHITVRTIKLPSNSSLAWTALQHKQEQAAKPLLQAAASKAGLATSMLHWAHYSPLHCQRLHFMIQWGLPALSFAS